MVTASTEIFEIEIEKLIRMRMLHVQFVLLDVRSKSDYEREHIPNAFHLDARDFLNKISSMVSSKEIPVVIYDADGKTTASLLEEAAKLGFINMVGLIGGFAAYKLASPPTSTP